MHAPDKPDEVSAVLDAAAQILRALRDHRDGDVVAPLRALQPLDAARAVVEVLVHSSSSSCHLFQLRRIFRLTP